ncbi:MAG: NADH-quinone oxidoreductase subunit L [Rickettsiales bacterium]|nr:NADH-quinone oxidoreductase subunit L [Rickettsiales bacterium]
MLLKLVLFLPLFGFLTSGIISKLAKNRYLADIFSQYFTTALLSISAICSLKLFSDVFINKVIYFEYLAPWINSGNLVANWTIKVDSLTSIMLVVVTLISTLVHLYSIGYMHEDKSISRFMCYLSLFTFFMLILVVSDNFLQLFVGWEGVGLASYLLIGFWFKKESANCASIKAFITNRVGDLGLIIAISLIYLTFGSIEFKQVFSQVSNHLNDNFSILGYNLNNIDIICIFLFIGAMGKSAQIGLHVWLADAMEGPTPVSALIHAATMVTAGVFLVARCSPIFEYSEVALSMITIVGAITALFSATIAITQNDIKKIIAYSTCSQLGYMFFACGLSAYSVAIFHLATHAFFKALLFLSAGSVIHAMHHEQNIQRMGGLYKKIPLTCAMMWIGSLALAGFPPLAGFFSKDLILEVAYQSHHKFGKLAYIAGITSAFLTAFYSWRLIFLVFYGKNRGDHHSFKDAHESPKTMTIPLIILSIGSIFAGFVGSKILHFTDNKNGFFADSIFTATERLNIIEEAHHAPLLIKLSAIIVGILAIMLAFYFYFKNQSILNKISKILSPLYKISFNKWYFDEIYNITIIKSTKNLGLFLWKIIDIKIIDRFSSLLIYITKICSKGASAIQTGYIYNHSLSMVIGLISIGAFLILLLKFLLFI